MDANTAIHTTGDTKMTRTEAKATASDLGVKYRITKGEVHFYGAMPNTNIIGWYFAGWAK